jgi:hypothetical protein
MNVMQLGNPVDLAQKLCGVSQSLTNGVSVLVPGVTVNFLAR